MTAKHIIWAAANSRSVIREDQAQHLAMLIRDLEEAVHRARLGAHDLEPLFAMKEYSRLISGAYATGWVCNNLVPAGFDLKHIANRPEALDDFSLSRLRRYIHMLMRSERHTYPDSSHVLYALLGGALGTVARRLESDRRLRPSELL